MFGLTRCRTRPQASISSTRLSESAVGDQVFEAVVAQTTPLGGEQTPEDIGNLAVFYASDKARMITGQVVAVDGGITLS